MVRTAKSAIRSPASRTSYRHRSRQHGFTLVELLVAGSVAVLLFAVMYQLLRNTADLADSMFGRVQMNSEARAAFQLIAEGGGVDLNASGTLSDAEVVAGIHGSVSFLTGSATSPVIARQSSINRTRQRIELANLANSATLFTNQVSVVVACTAAGDPHPDCLGAGDLSVNGMLSSDPTIVVINTLATGLCGGYLNYVASVRMTFTDAAFATRAEREGNFLTSDYQSSYRTFAQSLVDCMP